MCNDKYQYSHSQIDDVFLGECFQSNLIAPKILGDN